MTPKRPKMTVLKSQVTYVAQAVGHPEWQVRWKMRQHAEAGGFDIEFVDQIDLTEGGYFMAHTERSHRDRHAGTCALCAVPVYYHDDPPPNCVVVCVACGAHAAAAEAKGEFRAHD